MEHCKNYILSLWETTQTLFWASLGLISLDNFELAGIKVISLSWQSDRSSLSQLQFPLSWFLYPYPYHNCYILVIESIWFQEFTRFWGLVMFGTFSIINVIVLLNLLIAMMNNSYQVVFSVLQSPRKPDFIFAFVNLRLEYFQLSCVKYLLLWTYNICSWFLWAPRRRTLSGSLPDLSFGFHILRWPIVWIGLDWIDCGYWCFHRSSPFEIETVVDLNNAIASIGKDYMPCLWKIITSSFPFSVSPLERF